MLKIQFETENQAFENKEQEIVRILKRIIEQVEQGKKQSLINDVNGNTVGEFRILPNAQEVNCPFDIKGVLKDSFFYKSEVASNHCDGCDRKAGYQTTGSDDVDYFACSGCVKKYNLRKE